jgi:Flp pilus assembly protein TadB
MLWVIGGGLVFVWLVLKFLLHQTGYVHLLLISGLCMLVVQLAAERRTRSGRSSQTK